MVTYDALFEPDEGGYVITLPDFGCGVSQADSLEEGQRIAVDLLDTMLYAWIQDGKDLPAPKRRRGSKYHQIHPSLLVATKAELYRAFMASGIRKAELARRLSIPKTNVDRLFNVRHGSRLDQLEAAFRAIGMEMTIDVRRAA